LRGVIHTTIASDAWDKLNERYEGKGLHIIVHLIQEIFLASFSDEMPMAPQLYEVRYKVHILESQFLMPSLPMPCPLPSLIPIQHFEPSELQSSHFW